MPPGGHIEPSEFNEIVPAGRCCDFFLQSNGRYCRARILIQRTAPIRRGAVPQRDCLLRKTFASPDDNGLADGQICTGVITQRSGFSEIFFHYATARLSQIALPYVVTGDL